jgi:hypothetical protein
VLLTYAGMVPKRALVEPSNRGVMLNESEADVLAVEALGAGKGRHAADGKIADPNAGQKACARATSQNPFLLGQGLHAGVRPTYLR